MDPFPILLAKGTPMPKTHDNNQPNAPRSEAQIAAARRNGAKSKGPVTSEGKAASARNALRHGLTAFHLALSCEDQESFSLVLADYMDEYRPVGATETNLVKRVAFAQWQMYRAWTAETAILNVEIETNRAKLDEKFTHFAEPVRVADAIESSLAHTASLPHLNRCLARINRGYFQSLKMLRAVQKEAAETNPADTAVPDQPPFDEGESKAAEMNPTATAEPESNAAETNPTDEAPQTSEAATQAPGAMYAVRDLENGVNSLLDIRPERNRRTA
jgi:hypothetical protein